MYRSTLRRTVAWLLAAMLAGCVREPPPLRAPRPDPPRGEVTFRALADIAAPGSQATSTEEVLPPVPMPGNLPLNYPPRPLAAGHGPATVVVRVIIDAAGRVEQVMDSPLMESTEDPFFGDFKSAVEGAIRSWVFQPAQWRQLEEGKDFDGDGKADYRRVVRSGPIPVYLDLRFDFRVVDGQGIVAIP